MFILFSSKANTYKTLDGKAFKEALQNTPRPVLLDVRPPEEYALGTIKGSTNSNIMSPAFRAVINQLNKDAEYFIFGKSDKDIGQACSLLAKEGF